MPGLFDIDPLDQKDMQELFGRFNTSGDGKITAAEMKAALAVWWPAFDLSDFVDCFLAFLRLPFFIFPSNYRLLFFLAFRNVASLYQMLK